jgi:hypothetical protein
MNEEERSDDCMGRGGPVPPPTSDKAKHGKGGLLVNKTRLRIPKALPA